MCGSCAWWAPASSTPLGPTAPATTSTSDTTPPWRSACVILSRTRVRRADDGRAAGRGQRAPAGSAPPAAPSTRPGGLHRRPSSGCPGAAQALLAWRMHPALHLALHVPTRSPAPAPHTPHPHTPTPSPPAGCAIVGVEILEGALPVHRCPFAGSTAFMLGNEVRARTCRACRGAHTARPPLGGSRRAAARRSHAPGTHSPAAAELA